MSPLNGMKISQESQTLRRKSGFSLCDLLAGGAVLAIIAGFLVPAACSLAKEKARVALCLNHVKQLGAAHSTVFQEGGIRYEPWPQLWIDGLQKAEPNLKRALLCPAAPARPPGSLNSSFPGGLVNRAWLVSGGQITNQGSYAMNGYFYFNDPYNIDSLHFRTPDLVSEPSRTPVFADSVWVDFWPTASDRPPKDLVTADNFTPSGLSRVAIPRHAAPRSAAARNFDPSTRLPGAVNIVLADNHAETVQLEKLWSFSWHREWIAPAKRPGL
jgi:hypothetical protein